MYAQPYYLEEVAFHPLMPDRSPPPDLDSDELASVGTRTKAVADDGKIQLNDGGTLTDEEILEEVKNKDIQESSDEEDSADIRAEELIPSVSEALTMMENLRRITKYQPDGLTPKLSLPLPATALDPEFHPRHFHALFVKQWVWSEVKFSLTRSGSGLER
uniref:Uncharacterized protein n=1 Tax=Timema cristinae TaxID=61476 RepID=A0A7R9DES1_TIMCR|nr:unnamed protein product [Timema cristinae]